MIGAHTDLALLVANFGAWMKATAVLATFLA
jgi:hypothetical protein